jgi:hypothetical protein
VLGDFFHRNVPFIVGKKSPYVALKKLVSYSSDAQVWATFSTKQLPG